MIGQQNIASFAVESHQVFETFGVAALLDHKSEIHSQALHTLSGLHGSGVTARRLAEFGSKTDSAIFRGGVGDGKSGDPTRVTVHVRKSAEVDVSEALMPQETKGGATESADKQVGNGVGEFGQTDGGHGRRQGRSVGRG
jgi:hypothetical protein